MYNCHLTRGQKICTSKCCQYSRLCVGLKMAELEIGPNYILKKPKVI